MGLRLGLGLAWWDWVGKRRKGFMDACIILLGYDGGFERDHVWMAAYFVG